MSKGLLLSVCLFMVIIAQAQTQQGVVKTRGRMVNGVLQPGKGLQGATVYIYGSPNVTSKGESGLFSFPVKGDKYRIEKVQKKDYQLVDYSVCTEYQYSKNPLRLVMETPGQQQSDLLAKERTLRRNLQRKLQQREDEVDALNVSLEEKNRLLQEINRQREENEIIIKDLAQYYTTLDYDQLDDFQRRVNDCLENGELERADSLLRSRGDMRSRINTIKAEQAVEAKEEAELQQRQKDLEVSKEGTQKRMEDVAADCYSFYQRFQQDHQRDSAIYYLELRSSLDTTRIEWTDELGRYVDDYLADYNKALQCYYRVLKQSLSRYGEQDNWTATAYNNIGSVYYSQGDYSRALEYHTRALAIREKVLGVDHPDVAMSYTNIGSVYYNQGDYSRALEYHKKDLAICEKVLGPDHPDVATSYNNIGNDYCSQADYSLALEYHTKSLAIREKVLGSDHPDVAISYNNIGNVYYSEGDYLRALEYHTRALAIYEKVLGSDHPDVAASYNNIGLIYEKQGDYSHAMEYHTKALTILEKALGSDHPDVATSYNNIGSVYYGQGDYSHALDYYTKALVISERTLDSGHPDVATSYNNIGSVYDSQGDYSHAMEYYTKALSICEKALGSDHPDVATYYNNIGKVYYNQGDYSHAMEYYTKALAICEKALGSDHPNTKAVMDNIEYLKERKIVQDPVGM